MRYNSHRRHHHGRRTGRRVLHFRRRGRSQTRYSRQHPPPRGRRHTLRNISSTRRTIIRIRTVKVRQQLTFTRPPRGHGARIRSQRRRRRRQRRGQRRCQRVSTNVSKHQVRATHRSSQHTNSRVTRRRKTKVSRRRFHEVPIVRSRTSTRTSRNSIS